MILHFMVLRDEIFLISIVALLVFCVLRLCSGCGGTREGERLNPTRKELLLFWCLSRGRRRTIGWMDITRHYIRKRETKECAQPQKPRSFCCCAAPSGSAPPPPTAKMDAHQAKHKIISHTFGCR